MSAANRRGGLIAAAVVAVIILIAWQGVVGGIIWSVLLGVLVWVFISAGWRVAAKRFAQAALVLLLVTFGTTWLLSQFDDGGIDRQPIELGELTSDLNPCMAIIGEGTTVSDYEQCVVDNNVFRSSTDPCLDAVTDPSEPNNVACRIDAGAAPERDACLAVLGTGVTPEEYLDCRDDRRLDDNIFIQYGSWVKSVAIDGDLGFAQYKNKTPLSDAIDQRLPRTVLIFVYSQIIALGLAIPLGVLAAYQSNNKADPSRLPKRAAMALGLLAVGGVLLWVFAQLGNHGNPYATMFDEWGWTDWFFVVLFFGGVFGLISIGGELTDKYLSTQSFVLISIPVFVMGETLRYLFAIRWGWYDITGYTPLQQDGVGFFEGLVNHAQSIWLPVLVLSLAVMPVYLRLLRADMVTNLQQDFVLVAKAKGLPPGKILFRHVLRPSSLTLLTVAGVQIAQLVNGAVVIEFIYDLDGMGSFLIDSVVSSEFFPVQTIVALVAVVFVLANTIIDLVYTSVDPRVRVEASK